MGHVAVDGAQGVGLTFEEGLMALRALEASDLPARPVDQFGAYGCNMSIRASTIGEARFDERLALYGWQEDIDFTGRLRGAGAASSGAELLGVHLGVKAGRVSGVRFGYSQIVNPTYLIRKGSIPATFGLNLMARNVAANVLRSLWSEPARRPLRPAEGQPDRRATTSRGAGSSRNTSASYETRTSAKPPSHRNRYARGPVMPPRSDPRRIRWRCWRKTALALLASIASRLGRARAAGEPATGSGRRTRCG